MLFNVYGNTEIVFFGDLRFDWKQKIWDLRRWFAILIWDLAFEIQINDPKDWDFEQSDLISDLPMTDNSQSTQSGLVHQCRWDNESYLITVGETVVIDIWKYSLCWSTFVSARKLDAIRGSK